METNRPNSRFLFESQIVSKIDVAKSISKLDKLINESSKLQLANDQICIDFKLGPAVSGFQESQIKIGREVLGYDSEVFAAFNYTDLKERKVELNIVEFNSNWTELFNASEKIIEDNGPWRLVIKDDFSKAFIESDK